MASQRLVQNVVGDGRAALCIALDTPFRLSSLGGGVGGEAVGLLFANLATSGCMLIICADFRLRMQSLVGFLPALGEQRALGLRQGCRAQISSRAALASNLVGFDATRMPLAAKRTMLCPTFSVGRRVNINSIARLTMGTAGNGASSDHRLCSHQHDITQRLKQLGNDLCGGRISAAEAVAKSGRLREEFWSNEYDLIRIHQDEFRAAHGG